MMREAIREMIMQVGIIPVVRALTSVQAVRAAQAICEGGIAIVEITMTVPGALDAIDQLHRSLHPRVMVGAGTVMNAAQAERCIAAGAQFVVSPATDPEIASIARVYEKVSMLGALTPTEVLLAWRSGADFVKVFPCGSVGGAKYIRALRAPYPDIPLVPTGGVTLATAADFLSAGAAALGVGGELVDSQALRHGDMQVISDNARLFAQMIARQRGVETGPVAR